MRLDGHRRYAPFFVLLCSTLVCACGSGGSANDGGIDADGDGAPADFPYNLPDVLGPGIVIDESGEECLADMCLKADSPCFAYGDLGQPFDCTPCDPGERCGAGGVANRCSPQVCSVDGWCWESPLPQGNEIFALWGAENGEYWAVGYRGLILHWNGSGWRKIESGTENALTSVFGIAHDDVWIAGDQGEIFHYDGVDLTSHGTGGYETFWDVWGDSPSRIWFAKNGESLSFFNGAELIERPLPEYCQLRDIWGTSENDAWAVGRPASILRWNGEIWDPVEHPLTGGFAEVWASENDEVWVAGLGLHHFKDGAWSTIDFTRDWQIRSVHATGANDLWAVTLRGKVLRYDGEEWSCFPSGVTLRLKSVFSHASGYAWVAADNGQLVNFEDGQLKAVANNRIYWYGVWAAAENSVWVAGDYGHVGHWDGQRWTYTRIDFSESPSMTFSDIFGFAPDDIWVVGDGPAYHFDGSKWNQRNDAANLYRIWGSAPDDLWGVTGSRIVHFDGNGWQTHPFASDAQISGIWGTGPDDVWAVGYKKVLHWDGNEWTIDEIPWDVYSVSGTGPDDVWFSGNDLAHWDGFEFRKHFEPPGTSGVLFRGIWASPSLGVWAAGGRSTGGTGADIIHFEGDEWVRKQSGAQSWISDLYGLPDGPVWAVGNGGLILRYDP